MMGISVVIPAYNSQDVVGNSISSAWRAGASEVIVVDDGSQDSTAVVAEGCGAKVFSWPNRGVSLARERGIVEATHDLVVLLDADDELVEAGVQRSVALLRSRLDAAGVVGRYRSMTRARDRKLLAGSYHGDLDLGKLLKLGFVPGPPAAFVWRRDVLIESLNEGPARLHTRFAEDYELAIRCAGSGPILGVDVVTCDYRVSGRSANKAAEEEQDGWRIRCYYGEIFGVSVVRMSLVERAAVRNRRMARNAMSEERRVVAMARYAVSVVLSPVASLKAICARGLSLYERSRRSRGL